MKKYIFIFIFTVLLSNCSNDKDCYNKFTAENLCISKDLGINQLSRFSEINYTPVNGVNIINDAASTRWQWRIYNDTIEVAGKIINPGSDTTTNFIFFRRNGSCVDYLSSRYVFFDENVIFDQNGNIISGGYSWNNFNDLQFKLQKYKEDEIIIGDVNGRKFWMEFTPDVHRIVPYDYEQFYHN